MPNYDYECLECDHRFERLQRFSDPPVETCPQCGSAVRRVLHPVGIVFKGSGWYVTDSRSSNTATAMPGEKSEKTDSDAKDEKTSEKAKANGEGKSGAKSTSAAKSAAAGGGE